MNKDNIYRQPAVERLIEQSADGLVHLAPAQGDEPARKEKPMTARQRVEIETCLKCPYPRCRLDTHEHCMRLRNALKAVKKRKEGKQK